MNRGMQIRQFVPFFAKSVDPPIFFFKSEATITSGKVNVNSINLLVISHNSKEGNMLDDYYTVQFQ